MVNKMIVGLCLLSQLAIAQTEKTVKTSVQRATVFTQGAQLFSSETVSLASGINHIIFEGVSPYLTQNSIQANGKGDFVIMDVRYNVKYEEGTEKAKEPATQRYQAALQAAQDSIAEFNFDIQGIRSRQSALSTERGILLNNRLMKGETNRDSLQLFTQSLDFLRQRLTNIDTEILQTERQLAKTYKIIAQINKRIAQLNQLIAGTVQEPSSANRTIPQVIVTVMADNPTVAQIGFNYFVTQASWQASYDLRASKDNPSVELKHRAAIYQNTGVEWKDVYLTLSTGNPSQSSTKPTLSPFFLQLDPLYTAAPRYKRLEASRNAGPVTNSNANVQLDDVVMKAEAYEDKEAREGVEDYVQTTENMLRVEYEIKLKYTIKADNQPHNVLIQSKNMAASYNYAVVPKLDPDVFLMARITDWEDMNLIEGPARIYFDGSFVGESQINPRNTNDTLLLNLGRDKSIVVNRIKVKDRSKEKTLSDSKVATRAFEINVRNTKNVPIRLIVEDQMPVSRDASVKVEYLDKGDARFNEETGKLTWDLNIKSKDTKRLTFSYEVKYPKDRSMSQF